MLNGYTNGYTNGHTNGQTNGHTNGNTNHDHHDPDPLAEPPQPPEGLNRIHPLTAVDQSAPRDYIRWMYIFDFNDTSEIRIREAIHAIQRGVWHALRYYPFLAGKLRVLSESIDDNFQLCYNGTIDMDTINELFKYKLWEDEAGRYQHLCNIDMPVCHWKKEEFCAGPRVSDPLIWQPAFTLQANFLKSGGLVLCFAFHHSVADDWSINGVLEKISWGIQRIDQFSSVYQIPDISRYITPGAAVSLLQFPEWTVSNGVTAGATGYEDEPTNYIFVINANRALEWTHKIVHHLRDNFIDDYVRIVDCIVGIVWVEIIRAGQIDPSAPNSESRLHIEVNARDRLAPSLSASYFGNMSATSVGLLRNGDEIMATSEEDEFFYEESIRLFAIAAVVTRGAIDAVNNNYVRHRLTLLDSLGTPSQIQRMSQEATYHCMSGTRLSDVGVGAEISFDIPGTGSGPSDGKARFIRRPWMNDPHGIISVVPRRPGMEANWEVQVCLQDWQIESAWPLLKSWGFTARKDEAD